MRTPRSWIPTPSMTVALLALVVSLSGNAIAAKVLITSSAQIKKGVVNSSDVKDRSLLLADFATTERAKLAGPAGAAGSAGAKGDPGAPGPIGQIQGASAGGDLSGTYPNPLIAPLAVTAATLADDAVTAAKLADDAVGNAELADGAVGLLQMQAGSVGNDSLLDNSVGNSKLADNAIGNAEMASNAIANAEMADNAIGSAEVSNASLTLADLAVGSATNLATTTSINANSCVTLATGIGSGSAAVGDLPITALRSATAGTFWEALRVTVAGQFPLRGCNTTDANLVSASSTIDVYLLRP